MKKIQWRLYIKGSVDHRDIRSKLGKEDIEDLIQFFKWWIPIDRSENILWQYISDRKARHI